MIPQRNISLNSNTQRLNQMKADVLNMHDFDRNLRLLVLDAIERIEVSARSQWAYHLAHRHGPHAHLDTSLAARLDLWETNIAKLRNEAGRSDEVFIKHLQNSYSESLPAVWAVCEVMSLGALSRWYGPETHANASLNRLDIWPR